jgi:phosphopantothenoylcysteine decarboxylase/phosphopantothenate--cysteine ligase
MSKEAQKILHPYALEFATGIRPITEITGRVEHVEHLGVGAGKADLLLIAPCTGNTLSKIALGIDDSPITTFAATGFGTTPILLAPAMHESMYQNPFLLENMQKLRERGVRILDPFLDESKAKLPEPEVIVEHVLRALGPQTLAGRKVLVLNGSTVEPLDAMRVMTNKSTGRMGVALVREAFRLGADVTHWFGHGHIDGPLPAVPTRRFVTVDDLLKLAPDAAGFDAILAPAAISDFGPAPRTGKVPSDGDAPVLHLRALPKVIHELRKVSQATLVSFKAESGLTQAELIERARKSMAKAGSAFVVANLLEEVAPDESRVLLVDGHSATSLSGPKEDVARAILERLAREIA